MSACTCKPGLRCQPCAERGRATLLLLRVAPIDPYNLDPVALADARTSACDARAALCIAMGRPVEQINPSSGNSDRRLGSDAAVAVGRFRRGGPLGYRARTAIDAPLRCTRVEARQDAADLLDFGQVIDTNPVSGQGVLNFGASA